MTTSRELTATVSPILSTFEVRTDRAEGESQRDTEERLGRETLNYCDGPRLSWEGDTLVYRHEVNAVDFVKWLLEYSLGDFFFNDSVVCPTCKRVNEYKS